MLIWNMLWEEVVHDTTVDREIRNKAYNSRCPDKNPQMIVSIRNGYTVKITRLGSNVRAVFQEKKETGRVCGYGSNPPKCSGQRIPSAEENSILCRDGCDSAWVLQVAFWVNGTSFELGLPWPVRWGLMWSAWQCKYSKDDRFCHEIGPNKVQIGPRVWRLASYNWS